MPASSTRQSGRAGLERWSFLAGATNRIAPSLILEVTLDQLLAVKIPAPSAFIGVNLRPNSFPCNPTSKLAHPSSTEPASEAPPPIKASAIFESRLDEYRPRTALIARWRQPSQNLERGKPKKLHCETNPAKS